MENATKALLIIAGVFLGLLLISLMVYTSGQISNYIQEKNASETVQEITRFNKNYIQYNRKDVRGTDLLSLVNRILDFNQRKGDSEEPIQISIKIKGDTSGFYHEQTPKLIESGDEYTHENIKNSILNKVNAIEAKYTSVKAAKLASNIFKLEDEDKKEQLLKELKLLDKVDKSKVYDDILKYYQYQQLKRAHFDCTELTFTNDGRVKSFKFEFNGKFE